MVAHICNASIWGAEVRVPVSSRPSCFTRHSGVSRPKAISKASKLPKRLGSEFQDGLLEFVIQMTILKGKCFLRNVSLLNSRDLKHFMEEEEERRKKGGEGEGKEEGLGESLGGRGKSVSGHSTEAEKSKALRPDKLYV